MEGASFRWQAKVEELHAAWQKICGQAPDLRNSPAGQDLDAGLRAAQAACGALAMAEARGDQNAVLGALLRLDRAYTAAAAASIRLSGSHYWTPTTKYQFRLPEIHGWASHA